MSRGPGPPCPRVCGTIAGAKQIESLFAESTGAANTPGSDASGIESRHARPAHDHMWAVLTGGLGEMVIDMQLPITQGNREQMKRQPSYIMLAILKRSAIWMAFC